MEQTTQSMFCPSANLVSPYSEHTGSSTAIIQDRNGDGHHDLILEKDGDGNTFLHLVMPASAVNFLNGSDGSSLFNFTDNGSHNQHRDPSSTYQDLPEEDFDNVYVELGCKVYEVNKVYYRGSHEAS